MNITSQQHWLTVSFWLALLAGMGNCSAAETTYEDLQAAFRQQLNQLADKCDELQLVDQAKITRHWLVERQSERQLLFTIDTTSSGDLPLEATDLVQAWQRKFLQVRADHAKSLFDLARQKARAGDGTAAYQLLHETLHQDPSNETARRILGLGSPSSQRITRRTGTRTHAEFGWRRGRYWQIESQHYRITTNASVEAGTALAGKLELFHSVWRQVFFEYWSATESLAERFLGGNSRLGTNKKLTVVLFANRDEYIEQLQRYEPQIAVSLGYYMKGEQTAFFYAGDESVEPTWYHEATHQLFQELGDAITDVGEVSNFWLVEGIAVYMESLVLHDGYVTLGGVDAERLQYARVRALTGEFYLQLAELVRLGREDLQRHEEIRRIYTQAAGLAHFLMDSTGGKYRDALVDFLSLLYRGRAQPETLASRCGTDPETLDAEYREFLIVDDEDLTQLNPPHAVHNLALGRTKITDAGVKQLAEYTELQWIDLSFTPTTDDGFKSLSNCTDLRRLNLEGTTIGDKSLEIVARFSQLEELDLSGTQISDAGLAALENLKRLKVLWLTSTKVSDTGLRNLESLAQLEFLEVSQTNVTPTGLNDLKAKLPKLNRE